MEDWKLIGFEPSSVNYYLGDLGQFTKLTASNSPNL